MVLSVKSAKVWWTAAAVATAVIVGVVAGTGVAYDRAYASLEHAPAYEVAPPRELMRPVTPTEVPADERAQLASRLDQIAGGANLGQFGAVVTDVATGQSVWERAADEPLRPASSTKLLTSVAAIAQLGSADQIATEVVKGAQPGELIIKAQGDVWLDDDALDELAEGVEEAIDPAELDTATIAVDVSAWSGERILEGWNPVDVDAGFVAPMEPLMRYGARIGQTTGEAPRSHTPAADVARALADRLGVEVAGDVTGAKAAPKAKVIAQTLSPTLAERINQMMLDSDNVMAEAIGREVALARGKDASAKGATEATLEVLAEHGFNTEGTELFDNSGLSVKNRISPRLLNQVLYYAATQAEARPLLTALPVGGASGTLAHRYSELAGRGWVRAKTGTLDETSALAGVVTSQSGHQFTFAFISNGADVTAARAGADQLASALREV